MLEKYFHIMIQGSSQKISFQSNYSRLLKHAYRCNSKFYLIAMHAETMFKMRAFFTWHGIHT